MDAIYAAQKNRTIIEIPVERIAMMHLGSFPLEPRGSSPFTQTLIEYHDGHANKYEGSALELFYKTFQPKSLLDYLGIPAAVSSILDTINPLVRVFPWNPIDPLIKLEARKAEIEAENKEHLLGCKWVDGDHFMGPTTMAKGLGEFRRLSSVYKSIKENGYRIDNHDSMTNIMGMVLCHGNNWSVILHGGQHRASAMSALGMKTIPIEFRAHGVRGAVIRREDAKHWWLVRNGYLKEKEAQTVFDRLLHRVPPPCADAWLSALDERKKQHKRVNDLSKTLVTDTRS